jgi:hypothetical protein
MVQYSTLQYSTVQYSTVQYSTVQYSTVQYSASSHCPMLTAVCPLLPCAQAPLDACPSTCLDLGSFRVVFESAASCLCDSAEQYPTLLTAASDTWKVGRRAGGHAAE